MNVETFWKLLRENGCYETSGIPKKHLPDYLFARTDTYFYIKLLYRFFVGYLDVCRGRYDRGTSAAISHEIMNDIELYGGRIVISGYDNLSRTKGAVVYVCNHMSLIETMLLPCMVHGRDNFAIVLKESLFKYPFLGTILHNVSCISVGRRSARDDFNVVMTEGVKFLRNGQSVLLFPQATRNAVFEPDNFNSMGVKLAERAGVPLVPVALKTDFQRIGKIFRDIGPMDRSKIIYFKFGVPFTINGNAKEVHGNVVRFIQESLQSWM